MLFLLHNGYIGTEIVKQGGKFHSDHSASHNGQPIEIPAFSRQKPVAVPHSRKICSGNLIHHRNCSRCQDHRLTLKKFPASLCQLYLHRTSPAQCAFSVYYLHMILLKQSLYTSSVPVHCLLFVRLHFLKIKGNKIGRHAKFITVLHHPEHTGSIQKRFGWNTSPVYTGTAYFLRLNHSHLKSKLRCLKGGCIASRPGADYYYVKLFCHLIPPHIHPKCRQAFHTPSRSMGSVT